jgi:hypothetical protein
MGGPHGIFYFRLKETTTILQRLDFPCGTSRQLASLERDLAAGCRDHEDLQQQVEFLSVSRRELFGERDADREEKQLAEAVDRAGRTFEKAHDTV